LPQREVGERAVDAVVAEDGVDVRSGELAAVAHRDAEHAVVEGERAVEVGAGHGDVVEAVNAHDSSRARRSSSVSARPPIRASSPLTSTVAARGIALKLDAVTSW